MIFSFVGCHKEKSYSVKQLDAYSFRRNYFGSDTLQGKASESFLNRNPVQNYEYKTQEGRFYEELVSNGIIDNKELILNKFDSLPNDFPYKIRDKSVMLNISYPESFDVSGRILIFRERETIIHRDTIYFDNPTQVTFCKMDVNKNGTDELYALFEWYAANGDNYELSVYELEEN